MYLRRFPFGIFKYFLEHFTRSGIFQKEWYSTLVAGLVETSKFVNSLSSCDWGAVSLTFNHIILFSCMYKKLYKWNININCSLPKWPVNNSKINYTTKWIGGMKQKMTEPHGLMFSIRQLENSIQLLYKYRKPLGPNGEISNTVTTVVMLVFQKHPPTLLTYRFIFWNL